MISRAQTLPGVQDADARTQAHAQTQDTETYPSSCSAHSLASLYVPAENSLAESSPGYYSQSWVLFLAFFFAVSAAL